MILRSFLLVTVDQSTLFGMRGPSGLTINHGRGFMLQYLQDSKNGAFIGSVKRIMKFCKVVVGVMTAMVVAENMFLFFNLYQFLHAHSYNSCFLTIRNTFSPIKDMCLASQIVIKCSLSSR